MQIFLITITEDKYRNEFIRNSNIFGISEGQKQASSSSITIIIYDVTSESEITPSIKIDKPLVVYRFLGNIFACLFV